MHTIFKIIMASISTPTPKMFKKKETKDEIKLRLPQNFSKI
jgi:hypothetical protein